MRINLWSGILMVLVSLTLIIVLIPLGIDEPKKVRFAALAPSYYPYIVSTILLLLGAVIIIRSRREKATQSEQISILRHSDDYQIYSPISGFAASLEWAGFILSSSAALIVALILAGERGSNNHSKCSYNPNHSLPLLLNHEHTYSSGFYSSSIPGI